MSSNRWALIRAESSKVRLRPSDTQAVQQTSHRWRLKRECPLACFRFLRSGSRGRAFYKSLLRHCIRTGAAAKSPVILILRRWLCAQVEAGWKLSPARACFAFRLLRGTRGVQSGACGTWLHHRTKGQWCWSMAVASATGYIALWPRKKRPRCLGTPKSTSRSTTAQPIN